MTLPIAKTRNDILLKAISESNESVVYALDATQLVQESMERLDAWPTAAKHLGQGMMASLLLQALSEIEDKETVSLQWMCEGPFGHLYAEAVGYGEARGTILRPQAPVDSYETGLGAGILQVRRTRNGNTTTGVVRASGDVSTDMVEYLEASEQRNCGVNFSVIIDWEDEAKTKFHVVSALAYLIHILPQPTEQKKNEALLRWDRQMRTLGNMSRWTLRESELALDMLRLITGEPEPNVVLTRRVKFFCNCTEERAVRVLALLDSPVTGPTEIICEYCGRVYDIDPTRGQS